MTRRVVVAGSRFGQFYATGVAADPRFVLCGILSRGSQRSEALARNLGVEVWRDVNSLPDTVQTACVAVGGAVRGQQGPALAEAMMKQGIDVVIEHPLLSREWEELLRCAARLGRRCLLNTFYLHLPAVQDFIKKGRELQCLRGIRHIDVVCGVQVGFATLDVLAAILDGVCPWSLEPQVSDLSAMRGLSLVMAETPVSLHVLNEMAPSDDSRMTVLLRVSLTTDRGTLSLLSPHGPVIWAPAVVSPEEDENGLFPLLDKTSQHADAIPATQLWHTEPNNWGDIHRYVWPAAAAESLAVLENTEETLRCNQRTLELTELWQRIGEYLGFPKTPPRSLAPASLEQVLEQLI